MVDEVPTTAINVGNLRHFRVLQRRWSHTKKFQTVFNLLYLPERKDILILNLLDTTITLRCDIYLQDSLSVVNFPPSIYILLKKRTNIAVHVSGVNIVRKVYICCIKPRSPEKFA